MRFTRFLWVKFQLEHICTLANETEVRAQLQKLPSGLDKTYDHIWAKITEKPNDTQKWALKVLGWLLYASAPLPSTAIIEATAIDSLDVSFDSKKTASSLQYLIEVCGGLVDFDENADVLRFVHYSVQEFLKPKLSFMEDLAANVCFAALSFTEKKLPCWCDPHGFYHYAALNWQEHARSWREVDGHRNALLQRFFFDKSNFEEWNNYRLQYYLHIRFRYQISGFEKIGDNLTTPDQAASYFGLPVVVKHLLQKKIQGEDLYLEIPRSLCIAAHLGHVEIVRLLLGSTSNVNAQFEDWGTPLQAAAAQGNDEVIKLLLEAGANPHAERERSIGKVRKPQPHAIQANVNFREGFL